MTPHAAIAGLPIVLGGNVFGWTADEDASFAVLDRFYEVGGRMVDTAQGYSAWVPGHKGGESEAVIGKWLDSRGVRADMRIATKTNMGTNPSVNVGEPGGLAPDKIAAELEHSLDRLRTDYVDLYYAHRDDPETGQDEVAAGFDALAQAGKIRSIGASNFNAARLGSLLGAARARGLAAVSVLQNEYNLVRREDFGPDLQALCLAEGIVMFPWFGLGAGFLTGKYRTPEDLDRFGRGGSVRRFFEEGLKVLPVLDAVAEETGASHGAIALAWLLAQPAIAAPIASASRPEQLDLHVEATGLKLSDEHLFRLGAAAG